jgi:O-antigen/teichoic acid export membrane protein
MSTSGTVLRNIVWLAIEPTFRAFMSIALAGFVAARLGLAGYGQLTFAASFVVLFGAIANLGLNEVLVRTIARQPRDEAKLWWSVAAAKAVLLGVYLVIVGSVAWALGYDGGLVAIIVLMGVCQGLSSLENTGISLFAGRQHLRPAARLGLAKAITDAAVTVAVLVSGFGVIGLAASRAAVGVLSLLATILLTLWTFRLRLTQPSLATVRPLVSAGLGFAGISVLLGAGARGGILILEHLRGVEAVALFGAAMALIDRLLVFLPAIMGAVFPFFSTIRAEQTDRFSRSLARAFRYQCLMAVGLGLGIALLGPWLLRTTFPRGFEEAGTVIEVLGAYAALRAVNDLLNSTLQARGFEQRLAVVWGVRCVANLGLAALLAGPLGPVGLAWAVVVSDVIILSLQLVLLGRQGGLSAVRWSPLLSSAAAGALIFASFAMMPEPRRGLALALTFAAAYPLLLVLARAVSGEDYRYLMLLVRGTTAPESRPGSNVMAAQRGAS